VISRRLGISEEKAKRQIEALDRERNTFIRGYFFKNPTDPRHFDMLLDSARLGVSGCAGVIVNALESLQNQATEEPSASR
jgi:hypothetical protein